MAHFTEEQLEELKTIFGLTRNNVLPVRDGYVHKDSIVKRVTCAFDGLDDMEEHTVARLRESALAKLTEAERLALGVKD